MSDPQPTAERQVRIRRGPKVIRFVAVGAGLGAIAAFIDVQVTPKDANYSTAQALGFIALVLVPIGAALGASLAVLLDRVSIRRSRVVTAERIRARTTPPVPTESAAEDSVPVESAPVESAPVESAPVESAAVESAAEESADARAHRSAAETGLQTGRPGPAGPAQGGEVDRNP